MTRYTKYASERVTVYMTTLAYEKVGRWCVRKTVLIIKKQKIYKIKSFGNHPEKIGTREGVHFRCLNFY